MSSLSLLRVGLFTPLERVEDGALTLRDGRVAWVGPRGAAPGALLRGAPQLELPGHLVLPGLVDLHLNGWGAIDLGEADPSGVLSLARSLAEEGTTAFLPTLISSPHGVLLRAIEAIAQAAKIQRQEPGRGARILGVHLEGPYLNPAMRGAHPPEDLRPASLEEVEKYLDAAGAAGLRMLTLAPEVEGALPLIWELSARGVVVALGHTAASYEETRQAIGAGARHAVHAFNRYEPFHHRRPGALGAILEDERVSLEVIADGAHLHPSAVRLLHRTRPGRGIVLVSDMAAWGSGPRPEGAVVREGTLAGGATSLFEGMRNFARWCRLPLGASALRASLEPASVLGLEGRLGALIPGAEADLLLVDRESEELRGVMVAGNWVVPSKGLAPAPPP